MLRKHFVLVWQYFRDRARQSVEDVFKKILDDTEKKSKKKDMYTNKCKEHIIKIIYSGIAKVHYVRLTSVTTKEPVLERIKLVEKVIRVGEYTSELTDSDEDGKEVEFDNNDIISKILNLILINNCY